MTSEPKAFASLSSGLLARKGAARPAMRPQGFGQTSGNLDDLGWNDMGFETARPVLTPVRNAEEEAFAAGQFASQPSRTPLAGLSPVSPVHHQQAEIEERFGGTDEVDEEAFPEPERVEAEVDAPAVDEADVAVLSSRSEDEDTLELSDMLSEAMPTSTKRHFLEPVGEPEAAALELPRAAPAPRRSRTPRTEANAKSKAAFTLRLDSARHLKLRLACAVNAKSAQQLVTKALDELLSSMPEVEAMANQAPERADRKGQA